ncbi:MAG: hypothetical protein U0V54_12025 [Saprospiraceae bacterium]|nr:hypothetical protein [Saprospiraceae bacterium]
MKQGLLICLILLVNYVKSQQPYPLNFKGYGSFWQHLVLNDGGVGFGQTENIYTTLDVVNILDVDTFIYLLYQTKKGFLVNGVKLVKINPGTGEILWSKTDNFYTGNEFNQTYRKLLLDDKGRIVITGWRAKNNTSALTPNACIKKFDASSGQLIEYKVDTTQRLYSIVNDYINQIGIDSIYFAGTAIIEDVEENPRGGIRFYTFNNELKWDTMSQVIYNLPDPGDTFSREYITVNPRYSLINNRLLGIVTFYVNMDADSLKAKAELTLADFSDVKNIKVLRRFKFVDEIQFWPDEEEYYWISNYSEELQLSWRYPKIDVLSGKLLKACSFLALDTLGNVLARVDDIAQNGHWIYNLKCAGKLHDKYYLLGHRSDDRASFDIMEVDAESRVKLLVSVVTADRPSNDGFNGFNTVQKVTKDSLFIFSGALFTKAGDVTPSTTSTHYTMAFDLRHWMRPTSSVDVLDDLTVKLYPNPSNDFLNIEVPDIKGKLYFYAANGTLIKSIAINGSQSLLIDTSIFPVGINVITIEPAEKNVSVRSVTFAKM